MLRIYFLQQWFNLSDPQAEDAIYDSESMRRFARVELGDEVVPDETSILRFRHLLEQHALTQAILAFLTSNAGTGAMVSVLQATGKAGAPVRRAHPLRATETLDTHAGIIAAYLADFAKRGTGRLYSGAMLEIQ